MNAFLKIACRALLAATTISGGACAKDAPSAASWQWSQTGEGNFDVVWFNPMPRPQQGGGVARLVGGGDNATVLYADTPMLLQEPVVASLTGGGDNASISYAAPGSRSQMLVGATVGPDRRG
ncbi:hypothetical protein GCM10011504_25080 [Siccirubricoccus deserti]|uniref:Uncharacterized protein n=1 Tax=Siccirubricoccus deserti TaxID=2013562 RepID=A0A9X0R0N4_9PROT|nr:hypothetical protein [Siccirubricoccus deserti]MBC4016157.1 hypothetical protein [Siccirubricoccus deserti]GGC45580.1 hypothetical protein GCM10011504_25080 [Siccirubricoccus deserti]